MTFFENICKDIAETKAKIEEIKTEKEKEVLNNSKLYFRDIINGLYQAEKCCDLGITGKSIILDAYIITNRTAGMEYTNQNLPTLDAFYSIKILSKEKIDEIIRKEMGPRPSGRFSDIARDHYDEELKFRKDQYLPKYFDCLGKLSEILPGKEFFIGGVKKSDTLGERIVPTYLYTDTPLSEDQYRGFANNLERALTKHLQEEFERLQEQYAELKNGNIKKEYEPDDWDSLANAELDH